MRTLVVGWFSFETMGATAGDLLARDLVCRWLDGAGVTFDVAAAPPFTGDVDWRMVDPAHYSHLVFVCGPFGNGWPITDLLTRFADSSVVAVNVSLLEPLEAWNPFHALFERDGTDAARPDICFLSPAPVAPLVGVVVVHPQQEYEEGMHEAAGEAIDELLAGAEVTAVPIDTRLDVNSSGLSTAAQVESLIARMDVVVTTRLHGLVLALKNGVPALAIDPIRGGAKLRQQAETIGWPLRFTAGALAREELEAALAWCLTDAARVAAGQCAARASTLLVDLPHRLQAAVAAP